MKIMLKVKQLRFNTGLTQYQLASELGISDRAYRDIENGKAIPSLKVVERMEKYFRQPYQELLKEV